MTSAAGTGRRVLLTGANSPLGSALVKSLRDADYDVLTLTADRYVDKDAAWEGFRGIIHLGALLNVQSVEKFRLAGASQIVSQTIDVARKAVQLGQWLLFASSCEVYGAPQAFQNGPSSEDSLLAPFNLYGRLMVVAEDLVEHTRKKRLTTAAVLRVSSVYAAHGATDEYLTPLAEAAAFGDQEVAVPGPSVSRDYVWAPDAASAFMASIRALEAGDAEMPPLNIASGIGTAHGTVTALAAQIAGKLGHSFRFNFCEAREFDVPSFRADVTRAKHHLGWEPSMCFARGFYWMVEDLRKLKEGREAAAAAEMRRQAELVRGEK